MKTTPAVFKRLPASHARNLLVAYLVATFLGSVLLGTLGPDQPIGHAYIGPGAGIALLGSFLAVFLSFLSALLFLFTWPVRILWRSFRSGRALARAKAKRVVILGLDGMEPQLTEQYLKEGRLPNLARLKAQGSYRKLATTCPPLSPVAWSSFATGANPGKHNIFDFIARNPADYRPAQSSVRISQPRRKLKLGKLVIPLSKQHITALRRSKPFWTVLGEAGIFSAILRVPITFPPDRFRGVQLSAMCVPDLRGTHSMFSYYSEHQGESGSTTDGEVGGDVIRIERREQAVHSFLRGPKNTLRADQEELRLPFRIEQCNSTLRLHISGQKVDLEPGRYTDWVRVGFPVLGRLKCHGLCRFYLKRFEPPFEMYCTPVQIDPAHPVMPISHPRSYATYLSRLTGDYATAGLAEDTWALSEKRIDEDAFLEQSYDIHDERQRMFFDAIKRVPRGLVTCVFDAPDRIQHMFWRFIDPKHPALDNGHRHTHEHVIREMYVKMDDLVGRTMQAVDHKTVLFVMSDHGFKPFRRGVDLNAWLLQNGYLKLKVNSKIPSQTYLADVDWSGTRAYALGLAGIYLNLEGREAEGTVTADQAGPLVSEICQKLGDLVDSEHNEKAIEQAMPREQVYSGPYTTAAPDIVVGYNVGYRVSWDAAIGKCGPKVISDNTKAWSGDHCIHPALVPGILFCNRPIRDEANIMDMAPTALKLLGVRVPAYMDGKSLL